MDTHVLFFCFFLFAQQRADAKGRDEQMQELIVQKLQHEIALNLNHLLKVETHF